MIILRHLAFHFPRFLRFSVKQFKVMICVFKFKVFCLKLRFRQRPDRTEKSDCLDILLHTLAIRNC